MVRSSKKNTRKNKEKYRKHVSIQKKEERKQKSNEKKLAIIKRTKQKTTDPGNVEINDFDIYVKEFFELNDELSKYNKIPFWLYCKTTSREYYTYLDDCLNSFGGLQTKINKRNTSPTYREKIMNEHKKCIERRKLLVKEEELKIKEEEQLLDKRRAKLKQEKSNIKRSKPWDFIEGGLEKFYRDYCDEGICYKNRDKWSEYEENRFYEIIKYIPIPWYYLY